MLSREEGGCKIILEQGGLAKLKQLLLSKEDLKILQAGVRVLGGLTHNSKERVYLFLGFYFLINPFHSETPNDVQSVV